MTTLLKEFHRYCQRFQLPCMFSKMTTGSYQPNLFMNHTKGLIMTVNSKVRTASNKIQDGPQETSQFDHSWWVLPEDLNARNPFLEHALSSNRVCGRHFNGYQPAMYEWLRYVGLIYLEHVFDLIWDNFLQRGTKKVIAVVWLFDRRTACIYIGRSWLAFQRHVPSLDW